MGWSVSGSSENEGQYFAILAHSSGIHLKIDVYTADSASSQYNPDDADAAVAAAVGLLDANADFSSLAVSKRYFANESYTP